MPARLGVVTSGNVRKQATATASSRKLCRLPQRPPAALVPQARCAADRAAATTSKSGDTSSRKARMSTRCSAGTCERCKLCTNSRMQPSRATDSSRAKTFASCAPHRSRPPTGCSDPCAP